MARTYLQLRNQILTFVNAVGSTEVASTVDAALYETMKYIARKCTDAPLPLLIGTATYTWDQGTEDGAVPLGAGGFEVADMATPRRLFVKPTGQGMGKGYLHTFRDLEAYYSSLFSNPYKLSRLFPTSSGYESSRTENFIWTIDYTSVATGEVRIYPIQDGQVVTLYYTKNIPAFDPATQPPVPGDYDSLVLQGALVLTQEWLKEPDAILSSDRYLDTNLTPGIEDLKKYLQSSSPAKQISLAGINRYRWRR